LALQACQMGLVVHGMSGFDYTKSRSTFGIPEDYAVEAMFALGKPGDKNVLPAELQEREIPSDRKPLSEIVFEGEFKT